MENNEEKKTSRYVTDCRLSIDHQSNNIWQKISSLIIFKVAWPRSTLGQNFCWGMLGNRVFLDQTSPVFFDDIRKSCSVVITGNQSKSLMDEDYLVQTGCSWAGRLPALGGAWALKWSLINKWNGVEKSRRKSKDWSGPNIFYRMNVLKKNEKVWKKKYKKAMEKPNLARLTK